VLIMAFTAVLGHTTNLLIGRLPGVGQASALVKAESGGFGLAALVERVQAAAVTVRGVTLVLAPVAVVASPIPAVAMSAGDAHHIATNKNSEATWNGGPWTPRFQKIFNKAGMSLEDAENIIDVQGHKGPHPEEYHNEVLQRLQVATNGCLTKQACRAALVGALKQLAKEISTPGTHLNRLVTKQ